MSLNWEDEKETIFRRIKKKMRPNSTRKGNRHKFKQWSNIVLRIIYANKSATEVMNEEKDLRVMNMQELLSFSRSPTIFFSTFSWSC